VEDITCHFSGEHVIIKPPATRKITPEHNNRHQDQTAAKMFETVGILSQISVRGEAQMYKVVTTDVIKPVIPEEAVLKEVGASLIYGDATNEAELIELTRDADAIINYLAPVTAKVINSLERCQVIVRRGIGYDSVEVSAATAKGIPVVNVPEYCTDEVADHAMALLLSAARKISAAREQTRSGGWDLRLLLPIPALKDSTLGLVGFGKIPRAVAARAKVFSFKVQASDPFIPAELAAEHGVKLVSLEELLASSDFISIHVPLTNRQADCFRSSGCRHPGTTCRRQSTTTDEQCDAHAPYCLVFRAFSSSTGRKGWPRDRAGIQRLPPQITGEP